MHREISFPVAVVLWVLTLPVVLYLCITAKT